MRIEDTLASTRARQQDERLRAAAKSLLALAERVLGKDAGPADRMRYLTQLFLHTKGGDGPRPVDVLLACYDELFAPRPAQS